MEFLSHSDKQELVLFSEKRIVVAATGIQWGKTLSGAMWLKMMMHTYTSDDDNFIITSPSFPILSQSTLPPFLKIMEGWGKHDKKENCFRMRGGGTCWFRTGTNPDSVVGITNVRAILCDEAGLYTLYFWENIQARSSYCKAPIRIVTSPYSLNWLYKEIIRPKMKDPEARPDVDLIQAASKENPTFPEDEYEAKRLTMDPVRFQMMYGGNWGRMEGLVYKCYHEQENRVEAFKLPAGTRVFAGVDWGYSHPFVIVIRAITPTGQHYQIGEFYKTGMTIDKKKEIAKGLMQIHNIELFLADPANPDDIEAFNVAGLPCVGANNSIRKGIDAHYELIATRRYKIFVGTSPYTEDELEVYHYPEPKNLKPDQDDKEQLPVDKDNHCCFGAGTLVETPNGKKPIESIISGDFVLTPMGFREVFKSGVTGYRTVYDISFSNGVSIATTADHPFCVGLKGFKAAIDLTIQDEIFTCQNASISHLMAKSIDGMVAIGLLLVAVKKVANDCMLLFGSFITGRFQKTFIFITKTMIGKTMPSTTLNYYQSRSIANITPIQCLMSTGINYENKPLPFDLSHLCGINHQRAGRGIMNTRKHWRVNGSLKTMFAKAVVSLFSLKPSTSPNSVRIIVSRIIGLKAALITRCEPVLSVLRNLKLIDMPERKPVHLNVKKLNSESQRVYNLTVDGGCFFANGILVSNCDANRYVTIETMHIGQKDEKPKVDAHYAQFKRLETLKRKANSPKTENW